MDKEVFMDHLTAIARERLRTDLCNFLYPRGSFTSWPPINLGNSLNGNEQLRTPAQTLQSSLIIGE